MPLNKYFKLVGASRLLLVHVVPKLDLGMDQEHLVGVFVSVSTTLPMYRSDFVCNFSGCYEFLYAYEYLTFQHGL